MNFGEEGATLGVPGLDELEGIEPDSPLALIFRKMVQRRLNSTAKSFDVNGRQTDFDDSNKSGELSLVKEPAALRIKSSLAVLLPTVSNKLRFSLISSIRFIVSHLRSTLFQSNRSLNKSA